MRTDPTGLTPLHLGVRSADPSDQTIATNIAGVPTHLTSCPLVERISTGVPQRTTDVTGLFPGPVLEALREGFSRPAFEIGSRTVSRADLIEMVRRLAGGLQDAGLGPGLGIGLVLSLSPEAYAVHLAAHSLGCRVAAARPGWSLPQLADAMRGTVDVVVSDQAPTGLRAGPHSIPAGVPVIHLNNLLAHAKPVGSVPVLARPDDVARLNYTSGSEGQPKACAHTYRAISLAYAPDRWAPVLARVLTHFERCLIHQSLASPVMFTYLGRCLVVGGTAVIDDELALPDAIERHRITATMMPPALLDQVIRSSADLSSLRAVVLGGSPASPQLLRTATERLGPIVWQGYGQSEAGVISMLSPEDIDAGHTTSVGRPLPAVEVAIRDGEICVRSPHMMTGYWNQPEETLDVLRDGWLHTRDLGRLDADGLLYLTGRARDVIMVNAEVCYAGAIEQVLVGHPDVVQAYVVGVPDPETGEAIRAFVVPGTDQAPDLDVLVELVRKRLSANNVPKSITVIRDVPVSASGKPDKPALLERTDTPRHA
jgi:fatty-acyl-CoA synthase